MAISLDKSLHNPSHYCVSQVLLRLLVFSATLTAACLVLTSRQKTVIYEIPADARYTYSPAFQFFTYANIAAFGFSILSVIVVLMLEKGVWDPASSSYFYLFLHDLIMGVILGSGCAAAISIGWVGKYGNSHVGWTPICDHFHRFCNRVVAAIAVSYAGLVLTLILTVMSAKKIGFVRAA